MKFIDIGRHPSHENQQIFNTDKYKAYNLPFKKTSNCRFNKVCRYTQQTPGTFAMTEMKKGTKNRNIAVK